MSCFVNKIICIILRGLCMGSIVRLCFSKSPGHFRQREGAPPPSCSKAPQRRACLGFVITMKLRPQLPWGSGEMGLLPVGGAPASDLPQECICQNTTLSPL